MQRQARRGLELEQPKHWARQRVLKQEKLLAQQVSPLEPQPVQQWAQPPHRRRQHLLQDSEG